jgi:hypothetical protein
MRLLKKTPLIYAGVLHASFTAAFSPKTGQEAVDDESAFKSENESSNITK